MSASSIASASKHPRPRVAVIGTGGTFAMQARHAFDWVEYSESRVVLPIDALLSDIEQLGLAIDVVPIGFRMLGSTGIVPRDWLELARLVERTVASDPELAGIVVTHGTATMEETAWFLQLALPSSIDVPIVLTGAQRPANTAGSDAMPNLRAALCVACSPQARGLGALLVMDGTIHPARDVSKTSSFALDAFESEGGALGRVDADGSVVIRRRPVTAAALTQWKNELLPEGLDVLPRVDIVVSYAGSDGAAIDACVAAGARAIISMGLVPGRPANGERAALARAVASGVVVVQSSRARSSHVPPQAFLARDGVLAGGDLAAHKLRILLMLALAKGHTADDLLQQLILQA